MRAVTPSSTPSFPDLCILTMREIAAYIGHLF